MVAGLNSAPKPPRKVASACTSYRHRTLSTLARLQPYTPSRALPLCRRRRPPWSASALRTSQAHPSPGARVARFVWPLGLGATIRWPPQQRSVGPSACKGPSSPNAAPRLQAVSTSPRARTPGPVAVRARGLGAGCRVGGRRSRAREAPRGLSTQRGARNGRCDGESRTVPCAASFIVYGDCGTEALRRGANPAPRRPFDGETAAGRGFVNDPSSTVPKSPSTGVGRSRD